MSNEQKNNFSKAGEVIEEALSDFTVNLFKKKEIAEKKPTKTNLIIVGVASFLMLTVIDIITGIVTGTITNFLYGLLVVGIGVGSLAIAEAGYFYPFASKYQKIIAVFDGVVSIGSTLLIGVLAAVIYAVMKFEIASTGAWMTWVEIGLMVLLVSVGVTHAILWISYVLIDHGVQMTQNFNASQAKSENVLKSFQLGAANMEKKLQIGASMHDMVKQNKGALLGVSIAEITGEAVDVLSAPKPMRSFESDAESPNSQAGKQSS